MHTRCKAIKPIFRQLKEVAGRSMPLLMVLLVVLLLSWNRGVQQEPWLAPAEADSLRNPQGCEKGDMAAGRKIFEKICWTCHGFDGSGNGPAALNMKQKPANLAHEKTQNQSDGALYWKISNGRGEMAPFKQTLSVRQRWQLVCYLRELATVKDESKR
ncbi:MAG: cytochrome c [Bacteroidia bacterium]|nr:cytochrome c [Bacteroidia bacterium]